MPKKDIYNVILKEVFKIKRLNENLVDYSAEEILLLAVHGLRMDLEEEKRERVC
jgi:hypothetical protein